MWDIVLRLVPYLRDILEIFLIGQMSIQRDGGGLDGDATLLLVFSGIGESTVAMLLCLPPSLMIRNVRFAGFRCGNNTGSLDEGVGQGGFSVIDCERGQIELGIG